MSHLETFATAIQFNDQDLTCNSLTYSHKDDTKLQKHIQADIQNEISKYYSDIIAFYSQNLDEKHQQQLQRNEEQENKSDVTIDIQQSNYITNILDKLPKSRFNDISINQTVVQDSVKPKENQIIIHCNYDYKAQLKEHENTMIMLLKELKNAQKIIQSKDEQYAKLLQQQVQNEKIITQQGLEIQLLKERLVYSDALIRKFNLLQNNPLEAAYKNQISALTNENEQLKQQHKIYQQSILNYQLQNKLTQVKSMNLNQNGYEYEQLLKSLTANSPYYNFMNSRQEENKPKIEEIVQQNGYFNSCQRIKQKVENQVSQMANK